MVDLETKVKKEDMKHSFIHEGVSYSRHSDRGRQVLKTIRETNPYFLMWRMTLWSAWVAMAMPIYSQAIA